jgi:RNA polymerase sigma-70 factor (ECF subfamily)
LAPTQNKLFSFQSPDSLPTAKRKRLWATPIMALLASPPHPRPACFLFALSSCLRQLLRGREENFVFHDDKIVFDKFTRSIIRRKIKQLVGRAGFTRQDREDLEQELMLRLLQSLHRFDPDQGHQNVFVTTVIERAFAMIVRERLAKKRDGGVVRSLDDEPVDSLPSDQEAFDLASDLADILARLPDDLRALAERLKSQSVSQAARDLGVPRTTLQRQVQRLRQIFEDAGLRIYL